MIICENIWLVVVMVLDLSYVVRRLRRSDDDNDDDAVTESGPVLLQAGPLFKRKCGAPNI